VSVVSVVSVVGVDCGVVKVNSLDRIYRYTSTVVPGTSTPTICTGAVPVLMVYQYTVPVPVYFYNYWKKG
jgi:hypothetical protein